MPRLGRRVRRHGDLRQARLRRGRDRRNAARDPLRAGRGAALVPILARGAAREIRALRRRDVGVGARPGRVLLRRARPAATSPRSSASTHRCCRCCSTRSRRSSPSRRSRSAASESNARRLAALALASGGLALVVAGAGPGALDPLGVALGLGAAVVYSTYILSSEGVAGRVRAARARGARLHRRGADPDRRLGAARRAASGRADARRLGLADRRRRSSRRSPRSPCSSPACSASGRRPPRSSPPSSRS